MAKELISKKTRYEFREYFTAYVLREIEAEFDAADIICDRGYNPSIGGQRRSLVEQYYHSINWTNWKDIRKVLVVYENLISRLEDAAKTHTVTMGDNYAERSFNSLKKWIEKDGFVYKGGKLIPIGKESNITAIETAASDFDAPELHKQIDRMRDAVEDDPRLAIGTAKEIIETTCKTILSKTGFKAEPAWDIPKLVKETRQVLKLIPDDVPDSAKGAESIRKILSSLGTIAQALGELRNLYGTGHGPDGRARGLSSRHARLAAGAAGALASFLLETYEDRNSRS